MSITAASAERPATLADIFEDPISDARRMASILAGLLEDALGDDLADLGRPGCYHLTKTQVEDIMFAVYQTQGFVQRIETAFQEALA